MVVGVLSPTILSALGLVLGWAGKPPELDLFPLILLAFGGTSWLVFTAPVETRLKLLLLFICVWAMVLQVFLFWSGEYVPMKIDVY